MSNLRQKIRSRRAQRQFERALYQASPAMRNELIAMAAHQNYNH